MSGFKDMLCSNVVWILVTLVALGSFIATVTFHERAISKLETGIVIHSDRLVNVEQRQIVVILRLEGIDANIREIKEDVKDIKKIVLKPVFGSYDLFKEPSDTVPSSIP